MTLARAFTVFFVLSGFCSLVDQVVWLRLTMAAFGVTTSMVSILLAVFMAGLALGSGAGGRLAAALARRSLRGTIAASARSSAGGALGARRAARPREERRARRRRVGRRLLRPAPRLDRAAAAAVLLRWAPPCRSHRRPGRGREHKAGALVQPALPASVVGAALFTAAAALVIELLGYRYLRAPWHRPRRRGLLLAAQRRASRASRRSGRRAAAACVPRATHLRHRLPGWPWKWSGSVS
jgi:hypothetical protein